MGETEGPGRALRSGELARLAGVSSDTLRYYERKKLLPRPLRAPNGYRAYSPQALERVRLIRRSLAMGFGSKELADVLRVRDAGGAPCHHVRALAAEKLAEAERWLCDITTIRNSLRATLKEWDMRLKKTPRGRPARLLDGPVRGATPSATKHGALRRALRWKRKKKGGYK